MTTPAKLAEAYLLQSGLDFYRSLLQTQNSQIQSEIERLESQLETEQTQSAVTQAQQEQFKLLHALALRPQKSKI